MPQAIADLLSVNGDEIKFLFLEFHFNGITTYFGSGFFFFFPDKHVSEVYPCYVMCMLCFFHFIIK